MKALVYDRYGNPDVLQLREIDRPVPGAGEVLVKVHAASLNSWDWDLLRGAALVRPWGLLKPQYSILGCDIAGRVEEVGAKVQRLRVGDEVFGDISFAGWGGFAEYVAVSEEPLALKSPAMTFEQAAALPQAGVLAVQGLRLLEEARKGQRLLIIGAGGGVGTLATQIAKARGAEVTAVDSGVKLEMLQSVGADHVVDYVAEDFTRRGQQYDWILDVVGRRSIWECRRALSPEGAYVMVGATVSNLLQLLLFRPWIRKTSNRQADILMHRPNREDLELLDQLFESGQVLPVIDRCVPLEGVPEALRSLGEGRICGKAVVTV